MVVFAVSFYRREEKVFFCQRRAIWRNEHCLCTPNDVDQSSVCSRQSLFSCGIVSAVSELFVESCAQALSAVRTLPRYPQSKSRRSWVVWVLYSWKKKWCYGSSREWQLHNRSNGCFLFPFSLLWKPINPKPSCLSCDSIRWRYNGRRTTLLSIISYSLLSTV